MDPGPILFTEIQSTAILFYCFLQTIIFHTIRLILCYSKPVRLTTSLFRWGKVLWLCCAGSTLAPESLVLRRTTSRRHQPSTCFLAPPGSINLGFFLRENLLLCASYLPLGVPNEHVSYTPSLPRVPDVHAPCMRGPGRSWAGPTSFPRAS